jgi:SAM-dependent methyltransferase
MRSIDWDALKRLRAGFLTGATDYWQSEGDLDSYDQTFAQRIGWKWDFVLEELQRLGWQPPAGPVLDWGCGSGIAGRAYLTHFPAEVLEVWDRSELATRFAVQRARERFPNVTVRAGSTATPAVLLFSHLLTELTDAQLHEAAALCGTAAAVIWVEPGTYEVSRRLAVVRNRVPYNIVAPCPHRGACGMLAAGNERHWCHFFAPVPRAVFRDGNWARFAKVTGIDLRSLPVSYLVLDRRAGPGGPAERVIGTPRVYKAHALKLTCDASGVREREVRQRDQPEEFRRLKKQNP